MLLNQLAKRFGDLVGKGLPWHLIAEVFALSIPFILAMTMPMAVLVAVLYTFNRLSSDNEITALRAGGVSLIRLMLPVLAAATIIAGGMIGFNDTVLPESNHALRKLLTDISRKRPTFELRERVINEVVTDKLFLQAARIDRSRSLLRDLVIFDLGKADIERTIYADSGLMAFNEAQTDLYLTLFDGSMHEVDRDDPALDQLTYYSQQVIKVSGVSNELERGKATGWRGDREMNVAMMEAEIASRQSNLDEIYDSVTTVIATLPPVGPRPLRDTETTKVELPEATNPEDSARAAEANELAVAKARARGALRKNSEQPAVRAILQSRYRASWPPRSAASFASRVRSEFQRYDSRHELNTREVNRYKVEIHKKFAIPVAAVVFVLIGAPVGVRFNRGGVGMVIGVSLAVFCVYYVGLIGGEDLADRSIISPFWAMWAPNVLFGLVGCLILYYVGWGRLRFRRSRLGKDLQPRAATRRVATPRETAATGS